MKLTLGEKLKDARIQKSYTIDDLVAAIKENEKEAVSRSTISAWENDSKKPTAENLRIVAVALDVSADYLLGLSEVQKVDPDIRAINDYTGLSYDAILKLHEIKNKRYNGTKYDTTNVEAYYFSENRPTNILDNMISSDNFWEAIGQTTNYLGSRKRCGIWKNKKFITLSKTEIDDLENERGVFGYPKDNLENIFEDNRNSILNLEENDRQPLYLWRIQKSFLAAVEKIGDLIEADADDEV